MVKKSDYRDPRTNLFELLPEVFQSETNEAVFEDVFNRYLSKPQIELVDGFVGAPLENATQQRQIQEPTPHRQAFQLQPLLFTQVGNINHLASYVDILNEVERLGVDSCRLPLWGNTLKFNWAPPIDISKLVNFRDYWWFDTDDPTSLPQYITIENPCIDATQRAEASQETIDEFGDLQSIVALGANSITIDGDLTEVFTDGYVLFVTGSTNSSINATFFTTVSSSYDTTLDLTTIVISETITNTTTIDGDITLDVYLQVLLSQQNCACGVDVGWDTAPWDDNQVGTVLWSAGLLSVISQPTEGAWIAAVSVSGAAVGSPALTGSPAVPTDLSIWYDTTNNQLKQFIGSGSPNWQIVQNNFSVIVALVEGTHFWDYTVTCDIESNPWTDENNWFHKNHVPNFATAKQATLPIIEYDFSVQLNRWTFTDYVWKYRVSSSFSFAATTSKPTLNELIPFDYVISGGVASPILNEITLSPEHGDQTDIFIDGYRFIIQNDTLDTDNNGAYTVESSSYTTTSTTPGNELATVIVTKSTTTFSSANQSATSAGSPATVGSGGRVVPLFTFEGDFFISYNEHWLLDDSVPGVEPATGKLLPVATSPPTENTQADLDVLSIPISIPGVGEYRTSAPVDLRVSYGTNPYVLTMEYTVLPTLAPGGVSSGIIIPLDPRMILRAPIGESVVRVVYNGQQIYGIFTELDTGLGGSPFPAGSPLLSGSPSLGQNDGFVDSITLAFDLDVFDTLRITVGEQSVEDIGRSAIAVRTVEDNTLFDETGSPLGTQPETVSLTQYRQVDQLKTQTNEYPLFDIFDCKGETIFEANPIFKWRIDQTLDLNQDINLRIVGTSTTDYAFENLLVDSDTLPRPILRTYLNASGTNKSVWQKGLNDEEYVPLYVNDMGVVGSPALLVGDPLGDWEIPDQLYFNAEHENRQYVTFPEIITHFRSILNAQDDFPGVILSGSQAYLHEDINFGLEGRIKEHNDSYDTFLSSIFVNNVTPLGVIDFAHDQYENSLNTIKELYRRNLSTFLTDTSTSSINDFQGIINDSVITSYELNDFFSLVYGDTNAFISGSPEFGVKNWPATLPFVGLGFKQQPFIIEDTTLSIDQLIHHDSHRSAPSLTSSTRESIIQTLLNTSDTRVTGETFGTQQSTTPPDDYNDLVAVSTPRPGIYWYSVIGATRTLFRFEVTAVSATPPIEAPVGALWYDTSTDLLKDLQTDLTWQAVEGSPSEFIITQAWTEINFDDLLVTLLLEIEQRLYDAAPDLTTLDFDVNSVLTDDISCPSASTTELETERADTYFEEAFGSFLRDLEIDDAFSADQFYVPSDAFTWNYSASIITTSPKVASPQGAIEGGWWTQVYQNLYGTPYPHLEPWILQGYTEKPSWWDSVYLNDEPDVYGTRRWKHLQQTGSPVGIDGMWEDIRLGIVPIGQLLPSGVVSTGMAGEVDTWNYFSVNISDSTIDGFAPDDLFPPFWDFTASGGSSTIRSIFSDFAGEIVLPSADYTFDTGGPIVFNWEISSQRLYDDLTVSFRMQPIRFIHSSFGVNFVEVDSLQVNDFDCKVYSHRDVLFHGDIVNDNVVVSVDGINQWYVNFNRFNGFDVSSSDFRPLWQTWEPQLTYQFGSIIDTQTLTLTNSNFDITSRDFQTILKKSSGIDDFFLDAFDVKVLQSPNKLARFDTQHLWEFQIDTFFPTTRSLSYYEVHNYPVRADELNNTFKFYQFKIVDVDIAGIFFLEGDQSSAFTSSLVFDVTESTGNDGQHTAAKISYNSSSNRTAVTIAGGSPPTLDVTADGFLTTSYRTIPWQTGDKVELTSTLSIPGPLLADTTYFIIVINDTIFQLASTLNDALAGRNINLLSEGGGQISVGQIFSKFKALDGAATNRVWTHYALDTRFTCSFVPPKRFMGVQNLINIVDGYAVITSEVGWDVNRDAFELDPDTQQPVSWNIEIERFIDQAFRLPQQRALLPNTYPVSADPIADTFTFNNEVPAWQTGTKVSFSAGIGSLPTPLVENQTYYVISSGSPNAIIQVALTASDALIGVPLNIIGGGSTIVSIFVTPTPRDRTPSIEINPLRNNVWLTTPQGILSNVVDGPTDDIRNTQLITDQNRNQLTGRDVSVFRWDNVARIFVPSVIANSTIPDRDVTPYNTIHIASVQAFVDGYESIVLFNDYAEDRTLIYDPFVGLNSARFDLRFFRQDEFTQRPAIGGYFLTPDDEILRNIEANVLDLQNLYDTNTVLETTDLIKEGRRTLGYRETEQSFLDGIGLNPKSKFLFWRGMIQNKGSVKAVDAFTNSVNFEDALVDEYWAYKVADFGSNYEQEYPALNLVIDDSLRNEKRFHFLQPDDNAASTFEGILLTNQERWHNQPDVLNILEDNDLSFYFNAEITSVQTFTTGTPGAGSPATAFFIEADVPFDEVVVLIVDTVSGFVSTVTNPPFTLEIINSKLISFTTNPSFALGPNEEYRLYTINPAKDSQNPAKIIDVKDDRVVKEVPIWDPRRGHQHHIANNIVNVETNVDPASYTNALDSAWIDTKFWNLPEVKTTWWDTSQRQYFPYNDTNIFTLDARIENWGKLSEWSTIRLYDWTESDVPPSEWDDLAAVEELDISIDPLIRKTGRAKSEIFQRSRSTLDIKNFFSSRFTTISTGSPSIGSPSKTNTIVIDDSDGILSLNDRIVFTTDDELPLPIETGVFYFITDITDPATTTTDIQVSLTEGGDVLEIKPGPVIIGVTQSAGVDDLSNSTGLVNDFDTSGVQDITFSTAKTLGSSTGLTLGTQGLQDVDFSNGAVTGSTATGLTADVGGSQTISWVGSPSPFENCGNVPTIPGGPFHGIQVSVDGAPVTNVYFLSPGVDSYSIMAATIATALSGRATATCVNGTGIVVTSNSTGPISSILITDTAPFAPGLITNLPGGALDTPESGTTAPNFEAVVAVNGNNQTLDINGGDAQTFTGLLVQMNLQLFGATTTIAGGDLRITSNETGVASVISITDTDLFSSMRVGGVGSPPGAGQIQTAVDGTSVSYQTTIAVNGGGEQTLIITGDEAQTITQLINVVNVNISGATISLLSGDLQITSNSTGSNSTIDLLEVGSPPGLFFNLTDVIFPEGAITPAPVDGVDATTYTTEIDLENGPRLITVIGNEAQNWTNLLSEVNAQLPTGSLSVITRTGSPLPTDLLLSAGNSTVTITNDNLFTRLGATSLGSPKNANTNGVFFNQFIPKATGEGSLQFGDTGDFIVPPFDDDVWIQLEDMQKDLIDARDNNGSGQFDVTIQLGSPAVVPNVITADDIVDVYINGVKATGLGSPDGEATVDSTGRITITGTNPQDFITIRKEKHIITDEEADFDPDVFDDGSNLIQYKEDFNFSQTSRLNASNVEVPVYFFWVEDKTVRDGDNITMRQATLELETTPTPYMILDNLEGRLIGSGSPKIIDAPRRYTQMILRGLAGVVDDTDRYTLRFTRDFTLRDDLRARNYTTDLVGSPTELTADLSRIGTEPLDLKSHHTEWTLIREKQPFNIPRTLWDKATESMIAEKLTDSTSRVPSLTRELYDVNFNAMTRYGFGDEQAFVDGELALATLIDDLQDPNNDFSPIDINVFFAAHDFETVAGIMTAMDDIYNQFAFESINRIWFKILQDALTTQPKFADLFKTSWISLSGTQIFQTEELFTG